LSIVIPSDFPRAVAYVGILALIAALVWLTLAIRRLWKAKVLHERMDLAADGEALAERWLAAQGYRVLERQLSRRCQMHINGRVAEYDVRADLLVQMGEEVAVVEVKTGEAADPRLPSTRRQLREYCAVFEVDHIYLFDANTSRLHKVEFPDPS
jgi:Holliday junction resolvase-like predicted endonuclease